MEDLFKDNIIPERKITDVLSEEQNGQTIYGGNFVGGILTGTSYRSADGLARFEIFPEEDKTIGCVVYDSAGGVVFKTLIDGTDVGDVIVGDYDGGAGLKYDMSAGTFDVKAILSASSIHIPDVDTTASSFHVDTDGNTWWGCTHTDFDDDNDNAAAYILATGVIKAQAITLETNVVIKDLQDGSVLEGSYINALNVSKLVTGTISSKAITLAVTPDGGDVYLAAGKTDFGDDTAGFILGVDDSDGDKEKFEIGDSDYWFKWLGGGEINVKAKRSNLMLYDAVVDAAGYGDYTTIAAALTAAKKAIFVRAGTYTIDSDLTVTADTTIIGEDWTNTELAMDNASILVNNNNIVLRNLKITGNASGTAAYIINGSGNDIKVEHCQISISTAGWYGGPYFSGDRLSFVDCKITGTSLLILVLGDDANVDRNRLVGVDTDGAAGCAAELYFTGNDLHFTNNFFSRTDSGNFGEGIYCTGNRNLIANNKIVSDATLVTTMHIGGADTKVINNHIIGWNHGIVMSSDYRQVCMGNTVVDCGGNGITVSGARNAGYGYKTVIGNIIYNPGDAGIAGSSTRCVISGNAIYSAGGNGIEGWTGNEYYITVTSNEVSDCTGHGIYYNGDTAYAIQYSIISNNRIQGCDTGIYADAGNCVFVGNLSYNNTTNYDITDNGGCIIEHNHG